MNPRRAAQIRNELRDEDRQIRSTNKKEMPKLTGMYFFDVKQGQEKDASNLGITKTKKGKWVKKIYNTSGRTSQNAVDSANKLFGKGKFWMPESYKDYLEECI